MDDPTKDTIPRSAVEYCLRKETVSTNPDAYESHERFIAYMDDPDISQFGHWMHSNGFNCALVSIAVDLDKIPSVTPSAQPGWIPCSERLPDAEKTVLVTVDVRPKGFMHYKKVVKAFYESGKVTEDDSAYTWYNCDNLVENENGEYVVPEGWWEDVDYAEEFTAIDDCVTAWMPLPKPWKGEQP